MRGFCNMDKAVDCLFPGLNQLFKENGQTKPVDKSIFHFLYFISRMMSVAILLYFLDNIITLNVEESILQLEQSLSQKYITDIITNQTSNMTDELLQYNISATKTGCQCQEQIYPFNCSSNQILYQNCITINPNQQITLSKFPFQNGQNLIYGLPLWIVRGDISPMDKLKNKNYQDGLCKVNYTICSNQLLSICQQSKECPLSSFQLEKNLSSQIINSSIQSIFNTIRNTTSFISDLIVTNGSCSSQSQNDKQQDYILNEESKFVKYPKNLKTITQYQIKPVLFINNQLKNYYANRPGLDETNGTFEICALTFNVTEECSYTMLDLIDNVEIYTKSMLYLVIALLTVFILTFALLVISCFKEQVDIIYGILKIMEIVIILEIIALLVFNILYNQNIPDRCWLIDFKYILWGYILVGAYGVYGILIIIFIRFYCKRQNLYIQRRLQTNSKFISDLTTPIGHKSQSLSIHRPSISNSQLLEN